MLEDSKLRKEFYKIKNEIDNCKDYNKKWKMSIFAQGSLDKIMKQCDGYDFDENNLIGEMDEYYKVISLQMLGAQISLLHPRI